MSSVSLTNVSIFVVAVSMASALVNAEDILSQSSSDSDEVATVITPIENVVAASSAEPELTAIEEETGDRFTFTSLDLDQNGKLSQQEVVAGKNEWLMHSFNKIDSNVDDSLTEQELVDFVTQTIAMNN